MSRTSDVCALAKKRKLWTLAMLIFIAGFICIRHRTGRNRLQFTHSANQTQKQIETTEVGRCLPINLLDLRYCTVTHSGNSTVTIGNPFNLSSRYLRNLGIPLKDFASISRENLDDFVFATAASDKYFHAAMDAIGNVQKFLSNYTIYFYDLDFNRPEGLTNKIKSLCGVVYRKFNFSRYPSHVRYLKNYAFKPLIVHEMLSEFPRVFWIDSSIRFKTRNLSLTLDEVFSSGGILTFENGNHSNFAATHKGMYDYLPISKSAAVNTGQYGANSIYIHRTEEIYSRIIIWWVLCALKEQCMSPTHALICHFKRKDIWAGCHRFDQSAINILMAHHFKYNVSRYTSRHGQLDVQRRSARREFVLVCPTRNKVASALYFV